MKKKNFFPLKQFHFLTIDFVCIFHPFLSLSQIMNSCPNVIRYYYLNFYKQLTFYYPFKYCLFLYSGRRKYILRRKFIPPAKKSTFEELKNVFGPFLKFIIKIGIVIGNGTSFYCSRMMFTTYKQAVEKKNFQGPKFLKGCHRRCRMTQGPKKLL